MLAVLTLVVRGIESWVIARPLIGSSHQHKKSWHNLASILLVSVSVNSDQFPPMSRFWVIFSLTQRKWSRSNPSNSIWAIFSAPRSIYRPRGRGNIVRPGHLTNHKSEFWVHFLRWCRMQLHKSVTGDFWFLNQILSWFYLFLDQATLMSWWSL